MGDGFRFALAFRIDAAGLDTLAHQVILDRIGAALGELLVVNVAAKAVGVAGGENFVIRHAVKLAYQAIEHRLAFGLQYRFVKREQRIAREAELLRRGCGCGCTRRRRRGWRRGRNRGGSRRGRYGGNRLDDRYARPRCGRPINVAVLPAQPGAAGDYPALGVGQIAFRSYILRLRHDGRRYQRRSCKRGQNKSHHRFHSTGSFIKFDSGTIPGTKSIIERRRDGSRPA